MNLGQFHDRISAALRRGNSLDGIIPLWTAEAANLIEQNYTFSWMRRTGTVTLNPLAEQPNVIELPNGRMKSLEYLRPITWSDGVQQSYGEPLKGVDPGAFTGISRGNPVGFYLDGVDRIVLDAVADQELAYQIRFAEYTDWPVADNATPTLLQRGQALLTAEVLVIFAMEQRDQRLAELYEGRRQQAYNFLLRSEEELKWSHQNDLKMNYSGLV